MSSGRMESLTQNTTTAFLAGVALVQTIVALRAPVASPKGRANALGACVCLVAFLHYTWMRDASYYEKNRLRFGDWLVTCPLLLWELHEVCAVKGQRWAIGVVMLMVLFGYAAKLAESSPWRHVLFGLATVLFVSVAYATVRDARRHRELVTAFFGVWALYPVAFLLPNSASEPLYDMLDLVSKGLFGLYVAI